MKRPPLRQLDGIATQTCPARLGASCSLVFRYRTIRAAALDHTDPVLLLRTASVAPLETAMFFRRCLVALFALIAVLPAVASEPEELKMYTQADLAKLEFLQGRWQGEAPDGSPFFEEYAFANPGELRSTRFTDARFVEAADGSTVRLEDGQLISRWNEFSRRASSLSEGEVCFEPVQAPSSFCWERVSADEVRVTQRWTDAEGAAQQYALSLRRI